MVKRFPKCRDIVMLDFGPSAGHEQGGRRPALVVSNDKYNRVSGFMLAMPVTSKAKGYVFESELHAKKTKGVVLCDQIKSFDWKNRKDVRIVDVCDEQSLHRALRKFSLVFSVDQIQVKD